MQFGEPCKPESLQWLWSRVTIFSLLCVMHLRRCDPYANALHELHTEKNKLV